MSGEQQVSDAIVAFSYCSPLHSTRGMRVNFFGPRRTGQRLEVNRVIAGRPPAGRSVSSGGRLCFSAFGEAFECESSFRGIEISGSGDGSRAAEVDRLSGMGLSNANLETRP